jgi:hypothetical protein
MEDTKKEMGEVLIAGEDIKAGSEIEVRDDGKVYGKPTGEKMEEETESEDIDNGEVYNTIKSAISKVKPEGVN